MKRLFDEVTMTRTLRRITHEIIEQIDVLENVVFLGIKRKGFPLAKMLSENIEKFENVKIPAYEIDISSHRDDDKKSEGNNSDVDVKDKIVILVDDVLYTGRSVRAAMDAVMDLGRPSKIQFAVLVDRGHRELPIRPDYVGKNIPTSSNEKILVQFDDEPGIYILKEKGES